MCFCVIGYSAYLWPGLELPGGLELILAMATEIALKLSPFTVCLARAPESAQLASHPHPHPYPYSAGSVLESVGGGGM